jgi:Lysozyme like domain
MPAVSAGSLPFTFNPPPHPSLMHRFPGWTAGDHRLLYDEAANRYGSGETGEGQFPNLRLGRIVMGKEALSFAVKDGTRYGFRFLYNPTTVSGGTNVGTDFIPDPSSTITAVLQDGLEVINFELLLNRQPDVLGGVAPSDYIPSIDEEELNRIKERGTHYDLEFLYRVCNGVHDTNQMSGTGDIGILLPNPCELYLGPLRSRGALVTISATDQLYSANMVPVLTYVQVSFSRYLTINAEEVSTLESTGVTIRSSSKDAEDDTAAADSSAVPTTPSSTAPMNGAQVYQLATGAGWNATDARIATQIAWAESSWNPMSHNPVGPDNSYGLWQINMKGDQGPKKLRQYNLANNEALFDAPTNARVAYGHWKERSNWTAWSTYSNGKYKQAPNW